MLVWKIELVRVMTLSKYNLLYCNKDQVPATLLFLFLGEDYVSKEFLLKKVAII